MKKITIILKPTLECNFRCKYCYHSDTHYEKGKMSIELFEEIIKKTFSCYKHIELIFHGGEPLLMGYDFFEKALNIIKRYKSDDLRLKMGIQTNGFLLDEKFCELFQKNDIIPAISYDGPENLNFLREKTTAITSKIIDLTSKGYKLNLLGVINRVNLKDLEKYYNFAKDIGVHLKLNPIFKSGSAKIFNEYLIDSKEYVESLKSLFKMWIMDDTPLNHFDPLFNLTLISLTNKGHECSQCGCLTKWCSIHQDGFMYPCGRSYDAEYCLGNIKEIDSLAMAFSHRNFEKLLKGAIIRRNYCYETCNYYSFCQGGCNNDALLSGDITRPSNFMCTVFNDMVPFIKDYILQEEKSIKNPEVKYMLERVNRCQIL